MSEIKKVNQSYFVGIKGVAEVITRVYFFYQDFNKDVKIDRINVLAEHFNSLKANDYYKQVKVLLVKINSLNSIEVKSKLDMSPTSSTCFTTARRNDWQTTC